MGLNLVVAFLSSEVAFRAVCVVLGLATLLPAAESLWAFDQFGNGGLFAWPGSRIRSARVHRLLVRLFGRERLRYLFAVRLLGAITLVVSSSRPLLVSAAVILAASSVLFYLLHPEGHDGADQMSTLTSVAIGLGGLVPGTRGMSMALVFLAAQAGLAYVTAGIAKMLGPKWRSGDALALIMRTREYGAPWFARWLRHHAGFSRFLCWAVVAVEVAFPVALVVPPWACVSLCGMMLLMHLAIAVLMGLNNFLLAFAATYPAVLFVNLSLRCD